jgi:hypothetical protein
MFTGVLSSYGYISPPIYVGMNEYGALVGAFYEGRNKVNGRNWGSAV